MVWSEMLVLFLLHNILNIRWYGSLFKGKYTLLRIMQMIINISVLISMLCLRFSGVVMSRHVFAGLSIHGPMATARTLHLAASYWGFVLISIHLGFHWRMTLDCSADFGAERNPCYICMADAFYSNFYCGVRSVLFP